MKLEKINLNKAHRLNEIKKLSLLIQDTKLKSLTEIRKIAETIELLSNDKILKELNRAIEDVEAGRYEVISNINSKGGKIKNEI